MHHFDTSVPFLHSTVVTRQNLAGSYKTLQSLNVVIHERLIFIAVIFAFELVHKFFPIRDHRPYQVRLQEDYQ